MAKRITRGPSSKRHDRKIRSNRPNWKKVEGKWVKVKEAKK